MTSADMAPRGGGRKSEWTPGAAEISPDRIALRQPDCSSSSIAPAPEASEVVQAGVYTCPLITIESLQDAIRQYTKEQGLTPTEPFVRRLAHHCSIDLYRFTPWLKQNYPDGTLCFLPKVDLSDGSDAVIRSTRSSNLLVYLQPGGGQVRLLWPSELPTLAMESGCVPAPDAFNDFYRLLSEWYEDEPGSGRSHILDVCMSTRGKDEVNETFHRLMDGSRYLREWPVLNVSQYLRLLGTDQNLSPDAGKRYSEGLEAKLKEMYREAVDRAINGIREALHPAIIGTLERGEFPIVSAYNFAVRGGTDEAVLRRYNWAKSAPAFIDSMTHPRVNDRYEKGRKQLSQGKAESPLVGVIESDGDFVGAAAQYYGCDRLLIESVLNEPPQGEGDEAWLRACKFDNIKGELVTGSPDSTLLERYLALFRSVPVDRVPCPGELVSRTSSRGSSASAVVRLCSLIVGPYKRVLLGDSSRPVGVDPLERLVASSLGKWDEVLKVFEWDNREGYTLECSEGLSDTTLARIAQIHRFIDGAVRMTLCPYFAREDRDKELNPIDLFDRSRRDEGGVIRHSDRSKAFSADFEKSEWPIMTRAARLVVPFMLSECSLWEILEASKEWPNRPEAIPKANEPKQESWPAWCEAQTAPNGSRIVPITSSKDLKEWLARVNIDKDQVRDWELTRGSTRIFVVENGNNRYLLQMEFNARRNEEQFKVVGDFSGTANAINDVYWFTCQLNNRSIKTSVPRMMQEVEGRRLASEWTALRAAHDPSAVCGFDAFDNDQWRSAYEKLREVLPTKLKCDTVEQFCERVLKGGSSSEFRQSDYRPPWERWDTVAKVGSRNRTGIR